MTGYSVSRHKRMRVRSRFRLYCESDGTLRMAAMREDQEDFWPPASRRMVRTAGMRDAGVGIAAAVPSMAYAMSFSVNVLRNAS